MLEKLRSKSNSKYILIVFGIIIIVFIFWGVGPNDGGGKKAAVAVVDGEAISMQEFDNLYRRQAEYYRSIFKGQFNDEMIKKLDLKRKALDTLINRVLTVKAAKSQGISADEKEVLQAITSMRVFNKDGVFDKELYFQTLQANRLKPADFEKAIADDIITAKLQKKLNEGVFVTDDEVRANFLTENRKVNFKYVAVEPSRFAASIKVEDEEAKAYLAINSSLFVVPAKVRAFYVYAGFDALSKKAEVSAQEMKDYYEKNSKRFETPAKVRARHILIRLDENAADKEAAKKTAREKAAEALNRIKAGEEFAGLAKKISQDPGSAKHGGDLGWFPKGMMVKPFEEAAFALKKGELSGLVESDFGFHIILVEDKKDAGMMPLKEVEPLIKDMIKKQKAWNVAKEAVASLEKPFKEAVGIEELKKAATKKGIRHGVVGPFSQGDAGVELNKDEKLSEAVFALKAGQVSAPIETPEGVYIVKVIERAEAHAPEYKDAAKSVKERIVFERASEEAKKKAEELLKKVKEGATLETLAKSEKLNVEETGFFKKADGFIPKIGAQAPEKLFDAKAVSPNYPELISRNNRFYILKFKSAEEAAESGLVAKKEALREALLIKKQDDALRNWIKDLKSKAKIQVHEENM